MLRNLVRMMAGLTAILLAAAALPAQSAINTFQLKRAHGDPASYVYPQARHGYVQPLYAGVGNLDPVATKATWEVLESFFARNLGQ